LQTQDGSLEYPLHTNLNELAARRAELEQGLSLLKTMKPTTSPTAVAAAETPKSTITAGVQSKSGSNKSSIRATSAKGRSSTTTAVTDDRTSSSKAAATVINATATAPTATLAGEAQTDASQQQLQQQQLQQQQQQQQQLKAALLKEVKLRKAAEAQSSKHSSTVANLEKTVTLLKTAAATQQQRQLQQRDTTTLARIQPGSASKGTLAVLMNNLSLNDTTGVLSGIAVHGTQRDAAATATAKQSTKLSKAGATTATTAVATLSEASASGTACIQVTTQSKLIKSGTKLLIGSEDRFVTSVHTTGNDCTVHLEGPLLLYHATGTSVYSVRTTKAELKAFNHRQHIQFILQEFVTPIVELAVAQGECAVQRHTAQLAYEQRPVNRYIIVTTPVYDSAVAVSSHKSFEQQSATATTTAITHMPAEGRIITLNSINNNNSKGSSVLSIYDEAMPFCVLRRLFISLDTDCSGTIDTHELVHAVEHDPIVAAILCADSSIDIISTLKQHNLHDADKQHTNALTWKQFISLFRPHIQSKTAATSTVGYDDIICEAWASELDITDIQEVQCMFDLCSTDDKGRISLQQATQLIAEIDGVVPDTTTMHKLLNTIDSDGDMHVSFKEFVHLRVLQNHHVRKSTTTVGDWRYAALVLLRKAYSIAVKGDESDDHNSSSNSQIEPAHSAFMHAVHSVRELKRYLNMKLQTATGTGVTVLSALQSSLCDDATAAVSWLQIEQLLLRQASSSSCSMLALPPTTVALTAEVYEMVTDVISSRLMLLMTDGSLQVYDTATTTEIYTVQIITPTTTAEPYRRGISSSSSKSSFISTVLDTDQRVKVMKWCAVSLLLLINTTAADGCIHFYEPVAFTAVAHVLLRLTSNSNTAAVASDYSYLADRDILVCSIVKRPYVQIVCAVTGALLGAMVGHTSCITAMLHLHNEQRLITGSRDRTVRVWDLGSGHIRTVSSHWSTLRKQYYAATAALEDTLTTDDAMAAAVTVDNSNSERAQVLSRLRAMLIEYIPLKSKWRIAHITAVISQDQIGLRTAHSTKQQSTSATADIRLIEVRYSDDGSIQLSVEPHRLRHLHEATDNSKQPQWHFTAAPVVVGSEVAVWYEQSFDDTIAHMFDVCDADGSGAISAIEFAAAVQSIASQRYTTINNNRQSSFSETEFAHLIEQIDTDGDGVIVKEELLRAMNSTTDSAQAYSSDTSGVRDLQQLSQSLVTVVQSSRLLQGHTSAVTSLEYMPVSMLIVSGADDGCVRVWDPCATKHTLVKSSLTAATVERAVEYTTTGIPYSCVACLPVTSDTVSTLHTVVMPVQSSACNVVCDKQSCQRTAVLDKQKHTTQGFLYLMNDGTISSVTVAKFDKRYVQLYDAAFILVTASTGATAIDTATLRRVYNARSSVCRIIYSTTTAYSKMAALAAAVNNSNSASETRSSLQKLDGSSFVVFYSPNDGPTIDITSKLLAQQAKKQSTVNVLHGVVTAVHSNGMSFDFLEAGAVEPLLNLSVKCITKTSQQHEHKQQQQYERSRQQQLKAGTRVSIHYTDVAASQTGNHSDASNSAGENCEALCVTTKCKQTGSTTLKLWAVGRVISTVAACDFDTPMSASHARQCKDAYMSAWSLQMASVRAATPQRLQAAQAKAIAESHMIANIGTALRLHAFNSDKQLVNDTASTATQAFATALQLPSRNVCTLSSVIYQCAKIFHEVRYGIDNSTLNMVRLVKQSVSAKLLYTALKDKAMLTAYDAHEPKLHQHYAVKILGLTQQTLQQQSNDDAMISWESLCSIVTAAIVETQSLQPEEVYKLLQTFRMMSSQTEATSLLVTANNTSSNKDKVSSAIIGIKAFKAILKNNNPMISVEDRYCDLNTIADKLLSTKQSTGGAKSMTPLQLLSLKRRCKQWHTQLTAAATHAQHAAARIKHHGISVMTADARTQLASRLTVSTVTQRAEDVLTATASTTHDDSIVVKVKYHNDEANKVPAQCCAYTLAYEGKGYRSAKTDDSSEAVTVIEIDSALLNSSNSSGHTYSEQLGRNLRILGLPTFNNHAQLVKHYVHATVSHATSTSSSSFTGMRLVTERLHDYSKLSDVISEHGALGNAASVMVLRLWCKQLLTLLAGLHSHSLLLRDLSVYNILISPTGHTLKAASVCNIGILGVDGRIKPDTTVDIPTSDSDTVLLPPESVDNKQQQPTTSWDIWLFGAVLHVLALGTAPPTYGSNTADSARSSKHYDVLSAMHSVNSSSSGSVTSKMQTQTPLAQALLSGSFGAIMNIGNERTSNSDGISDTAHVSSQVSSLKRHWLHAQLQQQADSDTTVLSYTDTAIAVYKQCPQLCDIKSEHLSTLLTSWSTSEYSDSVTLQKTLDAVEITQLLHDKLRLTLTETCIDRLLRCVQATHSSDTVMHYEGSDSATTASSIHTSLAEALIDLANAGKMLSATQQIDLGSSLLEILVLCLSRQPTQRPTVHQLLVHPFFANMTGDNESIAIRAAAAYMTSGTNVAATLPHSVQRPLDTLLPQLMHADTAATDVTVDVSLLTTALRAVSTLLHWVPTGSYSKYCSTLNSSNNKLSALQHTDAVDAVMSQQLLPKLTALALRFLQCEESESMIHQQHDTTTAVKKQSVTAAVHHPIGMRVVLVLTRILEGLVLELQHSHSPVVHYVDIVLKCLTALYIGQEGCLSNVYGSIGTSSLVTSQQQQHIPDDTDRWCKELSDIALTVLVEAVSETGSGNALYPAVTEYIARCSEFEYSRNSHKMLDDSSAFTALATAEQHRTAKAHQQGMQHDATTAAMLHENSGGNGIGLIRHSNIVPYFVRGATYYEELLSLGKALSQIHTATGRSIALRARRQGTTYILTLVRMACSDLSMADDSTTGDNGYVSHDADTSQLQRAQLLVDFGVADKLVSLLHDDDADVRHDVLSTCVHALSGCTLLFREATVQQNPRAIVTEQFASSSLWLTSMMCILKTSTTPVSEKLLVLQALQAMTTGGERALYIWQTCEVVNTLKQLLAAASTITSRERNAVIEVLRSLASSGSSYAVALLSTVPDIMLESHGITIAQEISVVSLCAEVSDVIQTGGTLDEIAGIIKNNYALLCTAVRMQQYSELLAISTNSTSVSGNSLQYMISVVWAWTHRTWLQLCDNNTAIEHPLTTARVHVIREALCLADLLTTCGIDAVSGLIGLRLHNSIGNIADMYNALDDTAVGDHQPSTQRSMTANSGLQVFANILATPVTLEHDLYRAHPTATLIPLAVNVICQALESDSSSTIQLLIDAGLGLKLCDVMTSTVAFTTECRSQCVEAIQLCPTYAASRQARLRLFDRILSADNAAIELHEQLLLSGVVEYIVSTMLTDTRLIDVVNAKIPAVFHRFNATPLVRNEGLELMRIIVKRGTSCPTVMAELLRHIVRHGLVEKEQQRIATTKQRAVRHGALAIIQLIAHINVPQTNTALKAIGLTTEAGGSILNMSNAQWTQWVTSQATSHSSNDVTATSTTYTPKATSPINKSKNLYGNSATTSNSIMNTIGTRTTSNKLVSADHSSLVTFTLASSYEMNKLAPQQFVQSLLDELHISADSITLVSVRNQQDHSITIGLSMIAVTADTLYTRCLAGMLATLPIAFTHMEVQGKGRLSNDGTEMATVDSNTVNSGSSQQATNAHMHDTSLDDVSAMIDKLGSKVIHLQQAFTARAHGNDRLDQHSIEDVLLDMHVSPHEATQCAVQYVNGATFSQLLVIYSKTAAAAHTSAAQSDTHQQHTITSSNSAAKWQTAPAFDDTSDGDSEQHAALLRVFRSLDINDDGFITANEIKQVFTERGHVATDSEVLDWIQQRDTSGTGTVDFKDFKYSFVRQS
jgi:Ca2+-binding EF-hand superfamily protein/serine/threonine protein kinase